MRKLFFSLFSVAVIIGLSAFTVATIENVPVNLEKSSIEWVGKKVTGQHNGTIQIKDANLMMEDGQLAGGSFEIDMTTIQVTDLEGNMKGKLEGHLKSDDFFGVEKYPTAKFVITKVASLGTPGDYKVTGDLTIKEATNEIKFMAKVDAEKATADITVDRSEYDVRYGSGSFFDNLGDKTIYDDFHLTVNLVMDK